MTAVMESKSGEVAGDCREAKAWKLADCWLIKATPKRLTSLAFTIAEVQQILDQETLEDNKENSGSQYLAEIMKKVNLKFLLLQSTLRRQFFGKYCERTETWAFDTTETQRNKKQVFDSSKSPEGALLVSALLRNPQSELKNVQVASLVLTDLKRKQTVTKEECCKKTKLARKDLDYAIWRVNEVLKEIIYTKVVAAN